MRRRPRPFRAAPTADLGRKPVEKVVAGAGGRRRRCQKQRGKGGKGDKGEL